MVLQEDQNTEWSEGSILAVVLTTSGTQTEMTSWNRLTFAYMPVLMGSVERYSG